jgi:hypothetical protein
MGPIRLRRNDRGAVGLGKPNAEKLPTRDKP